VVLSTMQRKWFECLGETLEGGGRTSDNPGKERWPIWDPEKVI